MGTCVVSNACASGNCSAQGRARPAVYALLRPPPSACLRKCHGRASKLTRQTEAPRRKGRRMLYSFLRVLLPKCFCWFTLHRVWGLSGQKVGETGSRLRLITIHAAPVMQDFALRVIGRQPGFFLEQTGKCEKRVRSEPSNPRCLVGLSHNRGVEFNIRCLV